MAVDRPLGEQVSGVYPLFLINLQHKLAVVIGGGTVGERKVAGLLAAGAHVRLIAPTATPTLQQWIAEQRLEWLARPYQPGDLASAFLAFAATNQRAVNAQVAQEAATHQILCNVADLPAEGNFHVPALHRHGDFVVAIGSHRGKNPKLVKQLRDAIARFLTNFE